MAIKLERIKEIIREHDENPNPKLGGLNFYVSVMKIVLENEGTSLETWDNQYSQGQRDAAFKRAYRLIEEAIAYN